MHQHQVFPLRCFYTTQLLQDTGQRCLNPTALPTSIPTSPPSASSTPNPTSPPSVSPACQDAESFIHNGKVRDCNWVIAGGRCKGFKHLCPVSCNNCVV